jgi:hypothetical protein
VVLVIIVELGISVGLTPTGAQWNGTESHSHLHLVPWSGTPTDPWLWAPVALHYKRGGGRGMHAKVHRDLTPTLILPLIRSLRRSSGGKPPRCRRPGVTGLHRIWCRPPTLSQRPADLLPLHHQVPLCQLQRYWARRTCPPVRRTNPKAVSTFVHHH